MGNVLAIRIEAGYGAESQEPFIEINVPVLRMQMSPENARDLALNLLHAAEAAYSDAFLVEFFKEALEATDEATAVLVAEFRKWRETAQKW